MWLRHRNARQPLDAICVIACSTIADGSGISASNTPIRIRPPAMPNSPDRNAVATISRPSAAVISAVIRISAAMLSSLPRRSKLSYLGLASALLRVSKMRRLLFLNGMKAFEAAARSGSFAGGGAELNVSAAAISRLVQLLEQRLGAGPFEGKAKRPGMRAARRGHPGGVAPVFDAPGSRT